jgi:hypothetical protein
MEPTNTAMDLHSVTVGLCCLQVYPHLPPEKRPLEIVQRSGETIFVPGGWWHMVLNLEDTVAITQNFVSSTQLPMVVEAMAHGTGHVLKKLGWKPALKQMVPFLAATVHVTTVQQQHERHHPPPPEIEIVART